MEELTFSTTNRNKPLAVYHHFMYTLKRTTGDVETWTCKDRKCNGLLKVNKACNTIEETQPHNHPAEAGEVESQAANQDMKKKAAICLDAPRQIYKKATANLTGQAIVNLPKYQSCQKNIQRQRQIAGMPLPNPHTTADIDIMEFLQTIERGAEFLLADTGKTDPKRIIAFAKKKDLVHLISARTWLGDGTFKVAPPMFAQLYTIHAELYDTVIPLVYVLLPDKSLETYTRMLLLIRDRLIESFDAAFIGPKTMIVDFEKAIIMACQKVFPAVNMQGCTFHFGQSFYRRVQALGYSELYASNPNFNMSCKMILALAFLPVEDVAKGWDELQQSDGFAIGPEHPLSHYFVQTYIGQQITTPSGAKFRISPQYPIPFWNCHDRLITGRQRSTNRLEAWHLVFSTSVGCSHPTIYKFAGVLVEEQRLQEVALTRLMAGEAPPQPKRKYAAVTENLLNLAQRYSKDNKLEFLRGVALNLEIRI